MLHRNFGFQAHHPHSQEHMNILQVAGTTKKKNHKFSDRKIVILIDNLRPCNEKRKGEMEERKEG